MFKRRRKKRTKAAWINEGGGCVVGRFAKGLRYPCDDLYRKQGTEQYVTIVSTPASHAEMPQRTKSPAGLCKRGRLDCKVQKRARS